MNVEPIFVSVEFHTRSFHTVCPKCTDQSEMSLAKKFTRFHQTHPKRTRDEKERNTDQKNMNRDRERSRDRNRETEHGSDRNRHRENHRERQDKTTPRQFSIELNKQLMRILWESVTSETSATSSQGMLHSYILCDVVTIRYVYKHTHTPCKRLGPDCSPPILQYQ